MEKIVDSNMIIATNKARIAHCSFDDIIKYGIVVASNVGGLIRILENSFNSMSSAVCIKEKDGKHLGKDNKEINDLDTTLRLSANRSARNNGEKPEKIVVSEVGQVLISTNKIRKCEADIKRKCVKSEIYLL